MMRKPVRPAREMNDQAERIRSMIASLSRLVSGGSGPALPVDGSEGTPDLDIA